MTSNSNMICTIPLQHTMQQLIYKIDQYFYSDVRPNNLQSFFQHLPHFLRTSSQGAGVRKSFMKGSFKYTLYVFDKVYIGRIRWPFHDFKCCSANHTSVILAAC